MTASEGPRLTIELAFHPYGNGRQVTALTLFGVSILVDLTPSQEYLPQVSSENCDESLALQAGRGLRLRHRHQVQKDNPGRTKRQAGPENEGREEPRPFKTLSEGP